MKFFVSHASKDMDIAKCFSLFLSSLSVDVDVFCSSISGTINQGEDFVKSIEEGLNNCNVFIPLISKNYLDSKYCLIELGYAYAKGATYEKKCTILPFCIPPITRSQALLGTPLSHMQTAALNDKTDIHNFLRLLNKGKMIEETHNTNSDIIGFIDELNNIIMQSVNILGNAVILPICSDINNPDAIKHNEEDNKHIVNFNLFANEKNTRPDFISLVLKFPALFNFRDFMVSNNDIKLSCTINNYTNSLTGIDIEFKYVETHQMLKVYRFTLTAGENRIEIPIKEMNIEGLKQISEICFVSWDRYMIEEEGMFSIEDIHVR